MIQDSINKIQFAFRVVINENSKGTWEKYVFETSWKEYKIKEQLFLISDQEISSYKELLKQNSKANQLNHLVGISIIPYINQLNENLYLIKDTLNRMHLTFVDFELDIINSSSKDKAKHTIGLTFYTPFYHYFGEINGEYLLSKEAKIDQIVKTFMLPMQDNLSISSIQFKNE